MMRASYGRFAAMIATKAMIPPHSIAILTSSRTRIRDPRVRALADNIIAAQNRGIRQMDALIRELERR